MFWRWSPVWMIAMARARSLHGSDCSRDATIVNEDTNILEIFMRENSIQPIDCVVLDECQFLKETSCGRTDRDR